MILLEESGMTKHWTLSDLTDEEVYEFVGSDIPARKRRHSPASVEVKLTAGEVEQALEDMPADLPTEKALEERIKRLGEALLLKRQMALVDDFIRTALGPKPTTQQREAIQAALGHMYRLGGMFMRMHQAVPMYTPLVKAAAAADARKGRSSGKQKRDEVIDRAILAEPKEPPKRLLPTINNKLKKESLKTVSIAYVYGRRKILGLSDKES
jgi:hypothetical protein